MLLTVIEKTSAGDISSLASCCRKMHYLSQERLKFHKKKRAETKEVHLGWSPFASASHPLKHLQDIFENDDIRFYTRVIIIGYLDPVDPSGSEVVDENGNREDPRLEEGRKLITSMKSKYEPQISALVTKVYDALLPHANKTDVKKWTDKVISGEQEAVIVLLLALYPYLSFLKIEDTNLDWLDDEKTTEQRASVSYDYRNEAEWKNLFRSMIATAREPDTNKLEIFSKLSSFSLKGEEGLEHFQEDLGSVTALIALPAMRSIDCRDVAGHNVLWPYGIETSNVTSLTLSGYVDKASLRNVISGLKSLKDFSYQIMHPESRNYDDSYRCRMKWGPHTNKDNVANIDPDNCSDKDYDYSDPEKDHSDPDDRSMERRGEMVGAGLLRWEPRAVTACLLQYACDSLVSLELGALSFRGVSDLSNDEPFIPSLRLFQVLAHVQLDTMMLFEKVHHPKTISVISRKGIQRNFREFIKARKLVDFLPSSIEEVCMSCEYVGKGLSKRDVEAMFTGLPEQKKARLPKLSKIQFDWMGAWNSSIPRNLEAETEGWAELTQRCQDNGIELRSNREETDGSSSTSSEE